MVFLACVCKYRATGCFPGVFALTTTTSTSSAQNAEKDGSDPPPLALPESNGDDVPKLKLGEKMRFDELGRTKD